jgi:glycosyltransferase involved in cell wall biosynthesis
MAEEGRVPGVPPADRGRTDALPTPLSGCVITFQEEEHIADCVRSLLACCDEVVVLDSGSTDRTRALAAALGARVECNTPFPGHREQKQRAAELAAHDWVLSLDADERVTPALAARILELRRSGLVGPAYSVPRRNHYLGRVVRGGIFVPDRKVRLFDRRVARWGGRNPHDKVLVAPDQGEPIALPEPIDHFSYRDLRDHLRTIDRFTAIAARELRAEGRRFAWRDLLLRPSWVFGKSLLFKLGLRDGWRGVLIAAMAFWYDWLKYWRLRREWQRRPAGTGGTEGTA